MNLAKSETAGLALGAWGAVQASCAGIAIALGGALRDLFSTLAQNGAMDSAVVVALTGQATGYTIVYCLEIVLLLAGLIALGPLVGRHRGTSRDTPAQFGLREFPT